MGYYFPIAAKLDPEPIDRKKIFVRKAKILKKIEIEQKRLEAYRNTTKKDEGRKNKEKIHKSDNKDEFNVNVKSSVHENSKKLFEKLVIPGKRGARGEPQDEG